MRKKHAKFAGVPLQRVSIGVPYLIILAIKVPIAAPIPPIHGPNKTAKIAGIKTAGLSCIINPVGIYAVIREPIQYSPAQVAVNATSLLPNFIKTPTSLSILLKFKHSF